MSDTVGLERELRELGGELDWPETPDVSQRVTERLSRPAPPVRRRRRRLALVLAVLAAALVATLAVPQARSTVLRWLGLGSVRVELVEDLPPTAPRRDVAQLGPVLPRDEARTLFGAPLLRFDADALGEPDEIRGTDVPRQVSYLWLGPGGVRLLVSELPGSVPDGSFVKVAGPDAHVESLEVDGHPALWITGDAHAFGLIGGDFEELRLSGNALLISRGTRTIRIEGDLDRSDAVRVFRAID